MTRYIKHGVDQFVRKNLLSVTSAQARAYLYSVMLWEPYANAILAVLPLTSRNRSYFDSMAGKLK
jgi:hypothetical protein